jgi:hypothetical protein
MAGLQCISGTSSGELLVQQGSSHCCDRHSTCWPVSCKKLRKVCMQRSPTSSESIGDLLHRVPAILQSKLCSKLNESHNGMNTCICRTCRSPRACAGDTVKTRPVKSRIAPTHIPSDNTCKARPYRLAIKFCIMCLWKFACRPPRRV